MNINILTVGKLKEKFLRDAVAEYEKRLSAYAKVSIVEIKEAVDDSVEKEGSDILKKISDRDYVIALHVDSKQQTSPEFSQTLENLGIMGKSDISFIIGGSNGLSEEVLRRSDLKLSFSKMTFTHQMMRVILLEQIYRAFKIMKNEPYHK